VQDVHENGRTCEGHGGRTDQNGQERVLDGRGGGDDYGSGHDHEGRGENAAAFGRAVLVTDPDSAEALPSIATNKRLHVLAKDLVLERRLSIAIRILKQPA